MTHSCSLPYARVIAVALAAGLWVGGCFMGDGHGYQVWVTNAWSEPIQVILHESPAFEGTWRASYRADPGTLDRPGSFIDIAEGERGWVEVLTDDCASLGRFEVDAGDFGIHVSSDGAATIHEYGFGQRPTNDAALPAPASCLLEVPTAP